MVSEQRMKLLACVCNREGAGAWPGVGQDGAHRPAWLEPGVGRDAPGLAMYDEEEEGEDEDFLDDEDLGDDDFEEGDDDFLEDDEGELEEGEGFDEEEEEDDEL